jgi:hypothetical protein
MSTVVATQPLMVHVEGELGLTCRQPVRKLASKFIDLSVELGLPIVPVRFVGGLPIEPLPKSIPFPVDFGRQDYVLGKPLLPEQLALLRHRERKSVVLDAINRIEPVGINEAPLPPQHGFAEAVKRLALKKFDTVSSAIIETILSDELQDPELAFVHDFFAQKDEARSLDLFGSWERQFITWLLRKIEYSRRTITGAHHAAVARPVAIGRKVLLAQHDRPSVR